MSTEGLELTPLYDVHIKYGGKMVDFGGWALPVQFSGIIEEHQAVRNQAGLFDVSHMGEIEVTGKKAFDFVQYLVTNNVGRLVDGQVLYTLMCKPDGGIVDDLLVYRLAEDRYLLVVNAANTAKDWEWINSVARDFDDVTIKNISKEIAQIAIQGPKAQQILQRCTGEDLNEIAFFYARENFPIGKFRALVSRTGYTGEDGFEIYCQRDDAVDIFELLLDAGQEDGLVLAGLGARDTLRFEACLPLYGNELSEDVNPLEAGLSFFVKLKKGDFVGREAIQKAKDEGLKKRLVGFEMLDRGIARTHYPILVDGKEIGFVTSGSFSPTLGKNIGLGFVASEYAEIGVNIDIGIRNRAIKAQVIPIPFYKREVK